MTNISSTDGVSVLIIISCIYYIFQKAIDIKESGNNKTDIFKLSIPFIIIVCHMLLFHVISIFEIIKYKMPLDIYISFMNTWSAGIKLHIVFTITIMSRVEIITRRKILHAAKLQ